MRTHCQKLLTKTLKRVTSRNKVRRDSGHSENSDSGLEEVDSYFDFAEGDFQASPRVGTKSNGNATEDTLGDLEGGSDDDDDALAAGAWLVEETGRGWSP